MIAETSDTFYLQPWNTMVVSGQTGSRKTTVITELLEHWTDVTGGLQELTELHIYYENYQPALYARMKRACAGNTYFHHAFPDEEGFSHLQQTAEQFSDKKHGRVLVMDDLAHSLKRPERMVELHRLFNVLAHHTHTFVILIVHDLFFDKAFRTILKGASQVLLTKCHADWVSIGKTFFPGQAGFLREATQLAFYSLNCDYVIIDNAVNVKRGQRLKAGLLPSESVGLLFRER